MNQVSTSTSKITNGNGRIVWPGGPAKKQSFTLPDNIIYYMIRNPSSPEVYLQLATSCKYFFEKLPLIIAKRIIIDKHETRMCSNDEEECRKKNEKCCVKLDLAKISTKIWLHTYLYISGNGNSTSILRPQFYNCQNAIIKFCFVKITIGYLKLWGSTFQKFSFFKAFVVDKDGKAVTLDEILKVTSDIKEFKYWLDDGTAAVTTSTMTNILKLKNLDNLKVINFLNIPESLNIDELSAFIEAHKNTKFYLHFNRDISDQYKFQLDCLVDDVIASNVLNRLICYVGQDRKKLKIMESRFRD